MKLKKIFVSSILILIVIAASSSAFADGSATAAKSLHCLDFGPYVANLNPNTGPHPTPALIDKLLDTLIAQTKFRCIMTYGVLNGLDYTFAAAQARGIKVIAIVWVNGEAADAKSIKRGIKLAKQYPNTIIRVSCGSEVSTRKNSALASEPILAHCIQKMQNANIPQPLGVIDTWWKWCAESLSCDTRSALADQIDWIGVNIFPWWENKYSGHYTCIPAADAAQFTIDRLEQVRNLYSDKQVILTEFGWPAGPKGYAETNQFTGEQCGIASNANQMLVLKQTLALLKQRKWAGNVFSGFREPWKSGEGPVGPFWGICKGKTTFQCKALD